MQNEISITPSVSQNRYSEEVKRWTRDMLSELWLGIESDIGVNTGELKPRVKDAFYQVAVVCESRGVDAEELQKAVKLLCSKRALLSQLAMNSVHPEKVTLDLTNDTLSLFGELSSVLGMEKICVLARDISLIYCRYMERKYNELYDFSTNKPEYLLRSAEKWQKNGIELEKISDTDFSCIFRAWVSGTAMFSQSSESYKGFISGFSSGEILLYLRAEGKLLSELSLTAENYAFLIDFLGDFGIFDTLSAISSAGDSDSYSKDLPRVLGIVSGLLLQASDCDAKLLENGDSLGFLYKMFSKMTDSEIELLDSFLSSEGEKEKYISYFEKKDSEKAFEDFCLQREFFGLYELKSSKSEEFSENLKKYLAWKAPALAFAVYEL